MNKLNEIIDGMDSMKETIREELKKRDKDIPEATLILYDQIVDSTIGVLKEPGIIEGFERLASTLGEDNAATIAELIGVATVNASYRTLAFYDEYLQKEFDSSFKNIEQHLNMAKADVSAHTGVLEVFKRRLDAIEKKISDDELNKGIR